MENDALKELAERFLRPWQEQLPLALRSACMEGGHSANLMSDFCAGFKIYNEHPYLRVVTEPPVIWQSGSTRLLNYAEEASTAEPVVLFIPSLINRSYILDLTEQRSFLRYLKRQGIHPYLLDFGEPLAEELRFSSSTYITERVEQALMVLTERAGKPIFLAGYCMGGLMALAATIRKQPHVKGLALLATPWDFHKTNLAVLGMDSMKEVLDTTMEGLDKIPNQAIQAFFYLLSPLKIYQKFSQFSKLPQGGDAAEFFVSVERWVNDGISVTKHVARDCLIDWIRHNRPLKGEWNVEGIAIAPEKLTIPTLVAVPENDYIVPPAATEMLIASLAHATVIRPQAGHVGMVIGHRAEQELWRPFTQWVLSLAH